MITGIGFTAAYIIFFKFVSPELNSAEHWFLGISPEGIGTLGMVINIIVSIVVTLVTPAPPEEIQQFVEDIRVPIGAGQSHELSA